LSGIWILFIFCDLKSNSRQIPESGKVWKILEN
jgi:hypothetical protein